MRSLLYSGKNAQIKRSEISFYGCKQIIGAIATNAKIWVGHAKQNQ
jgi:hypothetical protein